MSRLHVDWTRCDGHGVCAELLPEMLDRDEWGYPIAKGSLEVDDSLIEHARHAVDLCPLLALRMVS